MPAQLKQHFSQGAQVLCSLPREQYINACGETRPAVVVRVDEGSHFIQAVLGPGDDATKADRYGFYATPATHATKGQPGTFWALPKGV